jgi:diaminopimelate decarboxylase
MSFNQEKTQEYSTIFQKAFSKNLIDTFEDRNLFFYDLSIIDSKIKSYKKNYPSNTIHSIPVKTAPIQGLLKHVTSLGCGLECASELEFEMAVSIQKSAKNCVINAPLKTPRLIKLLTESKEPTFINVNDLEEINNFNEVYSKHKVSLRINPLIDIDTSTFLQTATAESKFGQLISDKENIIKAFQKHNYLIGLHVHTGSDFTNITPTVQGIKKVLELAEEINNILGYQQITHLNIGGGLAAQCNIIEFCNSLKKECPLLYSNKYTIITELGRHTYLESGWAASTVELIKKGTTKDILLTHFGGQSFLREIYTENKFQNQVFILNSSGYSKGNKELKNYSIAGPLCYGGDFLTSSIELSKINQNDWLIIEKTGANTLGLFSKHCSQPFPKIIAYSSNKDAKDIYILKEKETPLSVLDFWK